LFELSFVVGYELPSHVFILLLDGSFYLGLSNHRQGLWPTWKSVYES